MKRESRLLAVFAVLNESPESAIHTIKPSIYNCGQSINLSQDSIMSQERLKTSYHLLHIKWASTRGNLSSVFANSKGTDQPAHL